MVVVVFVVVVVVLICNGPRVVEPPVAWDDDRAGCKKSGCCVESELPLLDASASTAASARETTAFGGVELEPLLTLPVDPDVTDAESLLVE